MRQTTVNNYKESGFVATISLLLVASGAIVLSVATLSSAVMYADSVAKRELRIQAGLNASACLDTVRLMAARDDFLSGRIEIKEFACEALVFSNTKVDMSIEATAYMAGVSAHDYWP